MTLDLATPEGARRAARYSIMAASSQQDAASAYQQTLRRGRSTLLQRMLNDGLDSETALRFLDRVYALPS